MSITFGTHKVEAQRSREGLVPAKLAWGKRLKPEPEACSEGAYLANPLHPLLAAIGSAYNAHVPLRLAPDHIWLAITQGLAKHVELNAEKLRHSFVPFEGKKYLEVQRDHFVKGSPHNDWPGCFAEFSEKIGGYIGKKKDLIVSDFTTTTPVAKAASELVLMDAMKSYFRYGMRTCCGFPAITLEGTPEDWESIWTRASNLAEFKLGWWLDHLMPVLEKFVLASKGSVDKEFWASAYKEGGGSGGPFVSGWVNVFFPYLGGHEGKNHAMDWQQKPRAFGGVTPDSYPSGLSKVPMLWHYNGTTFDMQLAGGFVGVEVGDDGFINAGLGWAIADDPNAVKDHECESGDPSETTCKHCGREVPREKLIAQGRAYPLETRRLAERGPPLNKLATEPHKCMSSGKFDEVCMHCGGPLPMLTLPAGAVYEVSEPEYVGEMGIRVTPFAESINLPMAADPDLDGPIDWTIENRVIGRPGPRNDSHTEPGYSELDDEGC